MVGLVRLLGFLLVLAAASPAHALPAPMSDQELLDKSDLVAVVRVLSVICTTVSKDAATGEDLPSYLAQLQLIEVKKGDAKPGDVVLVTWRAVPTKIVGPWAVDYYPGEEVLTHLAKRSGGVAYASTWWNAKGEDLKKPESTQLPTKPGESVAPPKPGVQAKPPKDGAPATPPEGAAPVSPPKHSEPGQPIDL